MEVYYMNGIKESVLNKLAEKFSLHLTESQYDTNFFSPGVGLFARNFIELIYEIEGEKNIVFDEKTLMNPDFCTFNGFVKEIEERLIG